ncbi:hypothetical protein [Gordonia sp. VNK21]|uniref:hypothetical protein n=1 Tax=Gordonia sp. VNK21 TaxID=3382483 RepID=UPI0038D371F7
MADTTTTSPVLESLELYSELAGEPTAAVYQRFFALHPESKEEFGGDEILEQRMMASLLQMLADLADGDRAPAECDYWVWDHIAYEVDLTIAFDMFGAIVDTLREGVGDHWTQNMEDGWRELIDSLRPVLTTTFEQAQG